VSVTAAEVKALRERTGAGMMECKKALVEAEGDLDRAVESMRKAGLAKADKKAGRITAEGRIALAGDGICAALVEVNSETDFVAGGDMLAGFADKLARLVLEEKPATVKALLELDFAPGESVEAARRALIAKLGENISVRRFQWFESDGMIGRYLHGSRIGVLVELDGGDESLARDVAMHVAASRPLCVSAQDVPKDLLERERGIIQAQAEQSGKPAEIVSRMVEGRLKKFIAEVSLTGQAFVKHPEQTVGALLQSHAVEVRRFTRFEMGEGIEKEAVDFATEVMAQVRGA